MTSPTALVNGEPYAVADGLTVDRLVTDLVPGCVVDGSPQGVAVAIDDAVVPRSRWAATRVHDGARVEVVTAVQGG
ncbi:sulfur carrier protein ThiS [Isoptericola variabilis]|uniref:Thiamine biosynthesis protein ThiS n=1 Tax=Isoptericola variabilis (strain 225) TaxID=743718 RepID=F6FWU8_ISOV2|nr:sulfur carrier protein ThiS [Isoptericola variabilis]AEG43520.1 thiamine biosynthesis protein ThiS [Isoptericola variabilis 225]TWH32113.1 sulfur carrier protein [Isoptericola variabilis J7]